MALFTEFVAGPSISIQVDAETNRVLGERQQGQPTLTREIQAKVVMSPAVATAIRNWLNEKIDQAEEARATIARLQAEIEGQQS